MYVQWLVRTWRNQTILSSKYPFDSPLWFNKSAQYSSLFYCKNCLIKINYLAIAKIMFGKLSKQCKLSSYYYPSYLYIYIDADCTRMFFCFLDIPVLLNSFLSFRYCSVHSLIKSSLWYHFSMHAFILLFSPLHFTTFNNPDLRQHSWNSAKKKNNYNLFIVFLCM